MARWIVCCALLVIPVLLVQADEEKTTKEKTTATKKETEGGKAFAALTKKAMKEIRGEKDQDEQKKLMESYADKFLAHARKYPKDPSAMTALSYVMGLTGSKSDSKARKDALALLKKEYVKSKLIRKSLRQLAGVGTDSKSVEIVEAVAKENPDRLTKALALRALATALEQQGKLAKQAEDNEQIRAYYEKSLGKDALQKIIDNAEKIKKKAEKYRASLKKDYKDVLPDVSVGQKAPKTVAEDLEGKKVALSDYKGKVVVLDFWATWCGPCRAMIPSNTKLVEEMDGKPFAFISISSDEKKETVTEFLEKTKMPWIHWWEGDDGEATRVYDITGIPCVFVIDHKGVIRHKQVGFNPRGDAIGKKVRELVKAAEAEKKTKSE